MNKAAVVQEQREINRKHMGEKQHGRIVEKCCCPEYCKHTIVAHSCSVVGRKTVCECDHSSMKSETVSKELANLETTLKKMSV